MYSRSKRYFIFLVLGFVTLASQIIILRKLMIAFSGNELTVGLALASWMTWAGIANFIAGRFTDKIKNIKLIIPAVILVLIAILPPTLVVAELIKPILGIPFGEMADLSTILLGALIVLGPLCFIDGLLLNLLTKTGITGRSIDIGEVYLFDALGSALGGIVYGWIAIEYLDPFIAICLLSVVLTLSIIPFLSRRLIYIYLPLAAVIFGVTILSPAISFKITQINWRGFNTIVNKDTRYQNIVITENRGEFTLFSDGIPSFTIPDKATSETLAHLPLMEIKNPGRVLIIGGGISGIASEFEKYDLRDITFLEIDPEVTRLEKNIMGGRIPPHIKVLHQDGRYYLNKFDPKRDEKYDVIIINTGDPVNAAANRYYTEEFFETASKALNKNGIIFFGVYQPANYISSDALELLTTLFRTTKKIFSHIAIIPLDKYYFIASKDPGILTDNLNELLSRLDQRGIKTDIFSTDTLYGTDQGRIREVKRLINDRLASSERTNLDNKPIAYFNSIALWAQKFGPGAEKLFNIVSGLKYSWLIALLLAAPLISLLFIRKLPTLPVFWTLFAVGWTGITIELIILIKYQVEVGMLFYKLGFIITAFMVGLSVGAFLTIQYIRKTKPSFRQILILLCTLLIYAPLSLFVAGINAMLANFIVGLVCGATYQISAETIVGRGVGKTAGLLNGADYIGAAAGSLIASIIIIPLFGLVMTEITCAIIITIAIITIISHKIFRPVGRP